MTIAGANESDYNGEFSITVTGATAFTYTVSNSPATPATGTITYRIAGSGWTKPFTGTNTAMYRQPSGSNMFYMQVDDNTTAREMRVRGFETASDVVTGTGPFPTVAQQATGGFWQKSSAADATARAWVMVCNGPTLYFWVQTNANSRGNTSLAQMYCFGDFTSYKTGDVYNTMIQENVTTVTLNDTIASCAGVAANTTYVTTAAPGFWAARSHTQIGSSVTLGRTGDPAKMANTTIIGNNGLGYPSPVDGGLYVAPIFIHEPTTAVLRGVMPGVWAPCHNRALTDGDTFSGTGTLAGKLFEAFNNNAAGQLFLEISNTW